MRHASVLQFPVAPAPRLPWDDPDSIHTGVHELIALAPVLGRRNPEAVPVVERMMRTLIGTGPGGVKRRPRAARPPTQLRYRPAKVTVGDVFERIHLSDPARQAEMAPMIRAYLKAQGA